MTLLGKNKWLIYLRKLQKIEFILGFIFFGESGTGKTSSAVALANDLGLKYNYFNASVNSKAELTKMLSENEVLIIDEIHRLNKDKQDILLSYLEFDKIIIYATTTENPYFRVNPALRSRMQILQFTKLSEDEMFEGVKLNLKKHFPNYEMDDLDNKSFC